MHAIDLFSGAGGLSAGLKRGGFTVDAAIEFDATALESHRANFPGTKHLECDVRDINFADFSGIDLIAGGPPCQPFSVSGKRLGAFDVRDMVPEFIRAVEQARPRAFILENVAGLTGKRFTDYLQTTLNRFYDLGYAVHSRVLNSGSYGVAQNRERLFIVGVRASHSGRCAFKFPEPSHGPATDRPYITVGQVLDGVPEDTLNNARVVFCKNPVLRSSPFAGMMFNGKGRPLNMKGLSHTIPASAGGNRTHIVDPLGKASRYHAELMAGAKPRIGELSGVRRLTVRESARLQSFEDSFVFLGRQSSRYSQVGNAVPPVLAGAVAKELVAILR